MDGTLWIVVGIVAFAVVSLLTIPFWTGTPNNKNPVDIES